MTPGEADEAEGVRSVPTEEIVDRRTHELEARLTEELGPELRITRELGRGAVGEVFLAREPTLKRLVAVKVLSPRLAANEKAVRRFSREAQAAARITHPNIVAIHRIGQLSDGLPYFVMQYVEGRSLAALLRADGPLSIARARAVLADIASALAAAHERRIVHRDVKASNLLIEYASERVFVTDFGIAAILVSGEEEPTRLTTVGHAIGDPRYMSPERLRGEEATELADIYSLGLLGYELLAGCAPFESTSNREWIEFHLKSDPRPVSELRPEVDPGLDELLLRCLAKQPDHRPSARDFERSLRDAWREAPDDGPGVAIADAEPSQLTGAAALGQSPAEATAAASKARSPAPPGLLAPAGEAYRLEVLGGLDLHTAAGDRVLSVVAQPKRVALFTYLAGAGNRFRRRDTIIGLFWPELSEDRARHALRQAVYVLRRSLGPDVVISQGDDDLALAEGTVWCDARAFEAALVADRPDCALELYRGPLLPGFFLPDSPEFERWLEGERGRFARLAAEAAATLSREREIAGDGSGAVQWARRALELSPLDERAVRTLMALLAGHGDRAGAIETYEGFARRLNEDLEADPSAETQALVLEIRNR